MSQSNQLFFTDSQPETFIRKMKQSEDFVPEEFVSKHGFSPINDRTLSNAALKEHFFQVYEPHKGNMKQQFSPINQEPNFYPVIILIAAVLPLIVTKILYFKSFYQLYDSLFSITKFRLWLRDTDSPLKRIFIFTVPAHALVLTLAIDFLIQKMTTETYTFSIVGYLGILTILISFYLTRFFLMWISASIFKTKISTEEQNRNILIHNAVLLQIMIVLLVLLVYLPLHGFHYILLIIIIFTEILRVIKGIISAISLKEYSVFYFFLYFCIVEVLPALVLIKIGTMLITNN